MKIAANYCTIKLQFYLIQKTDDEILKAPRILLDVVEFKRTALVYEKTDKC